MATLSLEQIDHLSITELKQFYGELVSTSIPARASRDFLRGNIAWALQVQQSGNNPAQVSEEWLTAAGRQSISPKTQYLPGTRLIREWHGVTHEVVIIKNGYRWQQRHYRSLSHIAREITGARWSGPRFFGLKERSVPNSILKEE